MILRSYAKTSTIKFFFNGCKWRKSPVLSNKDNMVFNNCCLFDGSVLCEKTYGSENMTFDLYIANLESRIAALESVK